MSKPTTKDGVNFRLEGCTLKVLGPKDIIQEGDFLRELHESGWLDGGFDSTYKPDCWMGTRWHKVSEEFFAWIGKSQMDFFMFSSSSGHSPKDSDYVPSFEIVRVMGES